MTTRTITLDILKKKKAEVEAFIATRVYSEWQCGQSDADSEADDYFDKLMTDAIDVYEDNNVYYNMSAYRRSELSGFVKSVVEEFAVASEQWLFEY